MTDAKTIAAGLSEYYAVVVTYDLDRGWRTVSKTHLAVVKAASEDEARGRMMATVTRDDPKASGIEFIILKVPTP